MKKILFFFLSACILAACSGKGASSADVNPTTVAILDVVKKASAAAKDAKSIDELRKVSDDESTQIEQILSRLQPAARDSFMADTVQTDRIDQARAALVGTLEDKAKALGGTLYDEAD